MIFHSTEFQFVLAVGNRSKRIVQLSWLSLCINLRKEQIDRSKGQRAYLFVNGRKEDVKFSRINLYPLFQSEAKCETFHMQMSFQSLANKTDFHLKGFALDLALKQRLKATPKWPIGWKRINKWILNTCNHCHVF